MFGLFLSAMVRAKRVYSFTVYLILYTISGMLESIHNKVSEFRLAAGLTQEELAQAVSVSRQTIIALEKGNYTPSILLALKLAGHFGVPVEKVFSLRYEK